MGILAKEASSYRPVTPHSIITPTSIPYHGHFSILNTHPDSKCAISAFRAGDVLLESVQEVAPAIQVGKLWIQQNESSSAKEVV